MYSGMFDGLDKAVKVLIPLAVVGAASIILGAVWLGWWILSHVVWV